MDNGDDDVKKEERENPQTGTPPVEIPPDIERLPNGRDNDDGDDNNEAAKR